MVVLLMSHCQPLLDELFASLGVHADTHWIAGRRGVVAENSPHLVKQSDSRIQKILGWKPRELRSYGRNMLICKQRICRSLRRRFFDLKPQTLRFLNDGVLDGLEFFLLGKRIVLSRFAFVVALQCVAQTIPDGIICCHLRQLFEFVHDGIHHILE